MKIAFVYNHANQSMPLGLGLLSSIAKQKGHDTEFFILPNSSHVKCLNEVLRFNPDMVCYSVITGNQFLYISFNNDLKEKTKDVIAVFGGPHLTFSPEMIYEEGVDAICRGEGDTAFGLFLDKIETDSCLPEISENFWIKKNGSVIESSEMVPFITDLDSLPFSDRDSYYKKYPFVATFRIKNFYAGRGCPYKCSYCFNDSYNKMYNHKNVVRHRSPKNICEEVLHVREKYPIKCVYFVDDSFTVDKKWVIDFCEEYARTVNIPFGCNLRFDNTTEEIVIALSKANCKYVHVGLESGNDYVRKEILNRNISKELMISAANLFHKYGIKMLTENLGGLPGETYDMLLETLRMNQEIKPTYANLSLFAPYPKLSLTAYAIENGYFDGNYRKIQGNYFDQSLIKKKEGEEDMIVNLRSVFSFLSRNPFFEHVLLKDYFLKRKNSKIIRLFGNLFDGFYMLRLIPYRFSLMDVIRAFKHFITHSR